MPVGAGPHGLQISYLIPIVVAFLIIFLRNRRPRRLRIERLWVYPVILMVVLAASLSAAPPPATPVSIGLLVLGMIVGAALGWQRGRLTRIDIHPETHDLTARSSPVGVALILAIFMLRYGLRDFLAEDAAVLQIPVVAAGEALVVMAGAMLSAQRLEVWLRARRILADAQAAPATPPIVQ